MNDKAIVTLSPNPATDRILPVGEPIKLVLPKELGIKPVGEPIRFVPPEEKKPDMKATIVIGFIILLILLALGVGKL